jgi:hypothetical protein
MYFVFNLYRCRFSKIAWPVVMASLVTIPDEGSSLETSNFSFHSSGSWIPINQHNKNDPQNYPQNYPQSRTIRSFLNVLSI